MLDLTRAYGLTFLVPAGDEIVGWSLRAFGEFARPEIDLLGAYVDHFGVSGSFIDVGANIGAVCLPLARRFPEWSFIAIEAHRGLSGVLAANALNNHLMNVHWHHAAAGVESALADFPAIPLSSEANFGGLGAHLNGTVPTERVRVASLDELAPADTRIVKIDVEGAEREVLQGSTRLLKKTKPVILLEVKRQAKPVAAEILQSLADAGYHGFLMFAPFTTPHHLKPARLGSSTSGDFNLLALPEGTPNLWNLPELRDPLGDWPTAVADFPYLERYGFKR